MPKSYFDDKPLDTERARLLLETFQGMNDFEALLKGIINDFTTRPREEIHAALIRACEDGLDIHVDRFLLSPLVIDEVLRIDFEPWHFSLVNFHWKNLTPDQREYLIELDEPLVRGMLGKKWAETYFDDKVLNADELVRIAPEFDDLKNDDDALNAKLQTTLRDPSITSRERIRLAIVIAHVRETPIGQYGPFTNPHVLDELLRPYVYGTDADSLTKTENAHLFLVESQWPNLDQAQKNFLIELGSVNVRLAIVAKWTDDLTAGQFVRLLTDKEKSVRMATFEEGFSVRVRNLLEENVVDWNAGDFSVLATMSDSRLETLREKIARPNSPTDLEDSSLDPPESRSDSAARIASEELALLRARSADLPPSQLERRYELATQLPRAQV